MSDELENDFEKDPEDDFEDDPEYTPEFIQKGHIYFSTELFNLTWEYIKQADQRSLEEDLTMLHTAIASLWHWTQREDVKRQNLSVGCWQVSRVYNLLKQPDNARVYGQLALRHAEYLEPFFQAYAYETLARAEMLTGNRDLMKIYLEKALQMAERIDEEEDREYLLKDLKTIQ